MSSGILAFCDRLSENSASTVATNLYKFLAKNMDVGKQAPDCFRYAQENDSLINGALHYDETKAPASVCRCITLQHRLHSCLERRVQQEGRHCICGVNFGRPKEKLLAACGRLWCYPLSPVHCWLDTTVRMDHKAPLVFSSKMPQWYLQLAAHDYNLACGLQSCLKMTTPSANALPGRRPRLNWDVSLRKKASHNFRPCICFSNQDLSAGHSMAVGLRSYF